MFFSGKNRVFFLKRNGVVVFSKKDIFPFFFHKTKRFFLKNFFSIIRGFSIKNRFSFKNVLLKKRISMFFFPKSVFFFLREGS